MNYLSLCFGFLKIQLISSNSDKVVIMNQLFGDICLVNLFLSINSITLYIFYKNYIFKNYIFKNYMFIIHNLAFQIFHNYIDLVFFNQVSVCVRVAILNLFIYKSYVRRVLCILVEYIMCVFYDLHR